MGPTAIPISQRSISLWTIRNTNSLGRTNRYLIVFGRSAGIVEPGQGRKRRSGEQLCPAPPGPLGSALSRPPALSHRNDLPRQRPAQAKSRRDVHQPQAAPEDPGEENRHGQQAGRPYCVHRKHSTTSQPNQPAGKVCVCPDNSHRLLPAKTFFKNTMRRSTQLRTIGLSSTMSNPCIVPSVLCSSAGTPNSCSRSA